MVDAGSSSNARIRGLVCLFVTAAVVSGCDQYTKTEAVDILSSAPGRSVHIVDPWIDLSLALNRGTAFSLVRDAGEGAWVLAVLALVVVAWMVRWLWVHARPSHGLAGGLIAGGALGNAYDRLFRDGVVDFVALTLPGGYRWPTFNVADVALVLGAAGLLLATAWARTSPPDPILREDHGGA